MTVYSHNVNDVTPAMVSATSPSPVVITSSSTYTGTYSPYYAFSNNAVASYGWLDDNTFPNWIQIYSGLTNGTGWYVSSYTMTYKHSQPSQMASAWTLYGSYDGVNYISLDTRTSQTGWGTDDMRTYSISSPGVYLYYKVIVTNNNVDANLFVGQIELIGDTRAIPKNGLQSIPHRSYFYSNNPVELTNVATRQLIGVVTPTNYNYIGA